MNKSLERRFAELEREEKQKPKITRCGSIGRDGAPDTNRSDPGGEAL